MWGCGFFLSVESVDLFLKRRFEGVDLDTFRKDGVEPFYFATSGFGFFSHSSFVREKTRESLSSPV